MLIGERIRSLRVKEQLSLRELARKAEVSSFGYLANIERGIVDDPGIKTIIKLAKALGMNIDELVGIKEEK